MCSLTQSLLGRIRHAVGEWRKREGWSREAVAEEIVNAHYRLGLDAASGIKFDSSSRDAFARMRANSERISRWLDDESKDTNLAPANFLPTLLAALPVDLRYQVVVEMLSPLGLTVTISTHAEDEACLAQLHSRALRETGEAHAAIFGALVDENLATLRAAQRELAEVIAVKKRMARAIDRKISAQEVPHG
ncbi:hypothetical protein QR66_05175 [Chromobacterium piscinae]|nr:hypothetical protein QR66_05175 [Chromobacterium piscinae]